MHGLINRAVECFVRDTYGHSKWTDVATAAGLEFNEFESMLHYPDHLTDDLITAITARFDAERDQILEDIGTYLVSHPNVEALRRLLRFSGVSFLEFLHSLDDLPERARLAVADLDLPELELHDHGAQTFSLSCRHPQAGFGFVLMGILRTMADDYGALVILEQLGRNQSVETIQIQVVEAAFSDGRSFELGGYCA